MRGKESMKILRATNGNSKRFSWQFCVAKLGLVNDQSVFGHEVAVVDSNLKNNLEDGSDRVNNMQNKFDCQFNKPSNKSLEIGNRRKRFVLLI